MGKSACQYAHAGICCKPFLMAHTKNNLSQDALQLIASRFRVLSEPTRLKLLMALEEGEKSVTELVRATGATQTNVSRQLAILTAAGLLSRRKNGLSVLYRIVDPTIFELCEHVCKSLQKTFEQQSGIFGP